MLRSLEKRKNRIASAIKRWSHQAIYSQDIKGAVLIAFRHSGPPLIFADGNTEGFQIETVQPPETQIASYGDALPESRL